MDEKLHTVLGIYNFAVTDAHADAGWNHFADKWEILDEKWTNTGNQNTPSPA